MLILFICHKLGLDIDLYNCGFGPACTPKMIFGLILVTQAQTSFQSKNKLVEFQVTIYKL